MTFKIDADGMVDVVAMASGTGSTKEMRVESSSSLSRSEVDELKLSQPVGDQQGSDPADLPLDSDDLEPEDLLTAEADNEPVWDDDDWDDEDDDDLFFDEDDEDDVTS